MNKDEALRLAIKALKTIDEAMPFPVAKLAIKECKAALEAKGEIDWKDMYEKQKRHTEMWVAKYEKDIGPLEKAVPQQEAKDEPVAWAEEIIDDLDALYNSEMIKENDSGDALIRLDAAVCVVEEVAQKHTTPPPVAEPHKRKPLTDEELDNIAAQKLKWQVSDFARAIEAAHGIKEEK